MKLGFLTTCLPENDLADLAMRARKGDAEVLEVAGRPSQDDRNHIKVDSSAEAERDRVRRISPGRPMRENVKPAEDPLVDHAGTRGVEIVIENRVMNSWRPDGHHGNLAHPG
ncbi:hypothetical protein SAMN05421874_105174 [Nonomuraea maritima]|uniref:Uncharacterized protein n=1 Tax=Nonomuraea maritima TaxID=683260 RepID=A0A1G8ZA93_9ACTN|nr:hypothetical protein [Nonomuraea maritima]SDK11574.1 hypothetical protein SAMN05421874_105174 [Nonomuraea maritima]